MSNRTSKQLAFLVLALTLAACDSPTAPNLDDTFVPANTVRITGKVYRIKDGKRVPAAGMKVSLSGVSFMFPTGKVAETTTRSDGWYSLSHLREKPCDSLDWYSISVSTGPGSSSGVTASCKLGLHPNKDIEL